MPPLAVILKVMKRDLEQHHKIFRGVWRLMEKFSSSTLPGSPGALGLVSGTPGNHRVRLSPISADLILAAECFQDAMITEELCPASVKKYLSSIKSFFSVIGHKNFGDLTNRDFDYYILKMKEKGAGNSRIVHVISALKWLLARLQKKGVVFRQLNLSTIKKPKIMKHETNYLTEHEIAQFLNGIKREMEARPTVKNVRFMALAVFLLQTGARIGEALSIDIADIDRPNKEVRIIGKGSKPRTLFLRQETFYWIDKYLALRHDSQAALFASQDGSARWKQTDAGRSFRRYKEKSGIKKDFVIHTFRHTFATQYLMRGAGINVVQTALGHADPVTTLKYYAAAVEKAKVREMINDRHFDFIPNSVLEIR
jgi:site-specific recombinase XerD